MLRSNRVVQFPELGASLETRALVHEDYRLHLVRNRRVVCEDALVKRAFERKGAVGRPVLTVVLAGRARLRLDGGAARWLEAGEFALLPSKAALTMRTEGEQYASIALEWAPGTLAARPALSFGRLSPAALAALARCMPAVSTDDRVPVERTAAAFSSLLAVLRAEGLPLAPMRGHDLIEPVSASTAQLSRTLDALLSRLDERPMAVDLDTALGLSARHISRLVSAFNARYGFNADGWRDTLRRRRITVGAALMSATGARTERVSASLGYSSPTAFCRAMAEAGLPAPGAVAREVHALQ
jgi:AraC-like DNA-binding protein